jgi:SAM-dependent methyltransferase
MARMSRARRAEFDKYDVYTKMVQSPEYDAKYLRSLYKRFRGKYPEVLREDFCGTHALSREWVKLRSGNHAVGVDIDPEPITYGLQRNKIELTAEQKKRLVVTRGNVLTSPLSKADLVCAFNFSYFCLLTRQELLKYCKRVKASLKPGGIFVLDIFGGPEHGGPSCETRRTSGVTYKFEQDLFDPISNRARFHIHFKRAGERAHKKAFTYNWRMWSIPEVRDILMDAGFSETLVLWEGTGKNGRGNGIYSKRDKGESCEAWTAHIVGLR